jgi:Zn finger protein HypA/HybF involved in hydrogenase expression
LEKSFSREEAGAIEKVSSDELENFHVLCPHCGNHEHGMCSCGTITCIDPSKTEEYGIKVVCPVCGKTVYMTYGHSFNINQSMG